MADEEKPAETTPEAKPEPEQPKEQKAPESQGKGKKVIALLILLVVIVGGIIGVALYGGDLFGDVIKDMGGEVTQPGYVPMEKIDVGTPGGTATMTLEGAQEAAEEYDEEDNEVYVYCRELNSGDKVTMLGDEDKYQIEGPSYFVYVDEDPFMWFAHDVKYIFIDASTGEKTVYEESWPPDINGEDMFLAAEKDCPEANLTQVYESTVDEGEVPEEDNTIDTLI